MAVRIAKAFYYNNTLYLFEIKYSYRLMSRTASPDCCPIFMLQNTQYFSNNPGMSDVIHEQSF